MRTTQYEALSCESPVPCATTHSSSKTSRLTLKGRSLLKVLTCGVCRTDLHIATGELPQKQQALIQGHQIVAEVLESPSAEFPAGSRVGVSWVGGTDGTCNFCASGPRKHPRQPHLRPLHPQRKLRRTHHRRTDCEYPRWRYTYSFEEIRDWLTEAGFTNARLLEAPGPSPLVLATKP
ncbi:MAG TPA: alcohol dehydrogenase catalytic domain-containing protein [Edaphobacter sp.]|nr:alcohol dehydrogenase catalytic domain-containing protein [Edaphobacter sp.]